MSGTPREPFLTRLRNNWVMVVIFCGIGLLLVAGGLVIKHFSDAGQRDLTATTTAHVLAGAKESTTSDCSGRRCSTDYDCDFEYEYTPAGAAKPYKNSSSDDGKCDETEAEGATRAAYYNPDDPNDVSLYDPNSSDQKYAWLWLAGPGVLCFVAAGWALKPQRRTMSRS
jgi:hypothetical protein